MSSLVRFGKGLEKSEADIVFAYENINSSLMLVIFDWHNLESCTNWELNIYVYSMLHALALGIHLTVATGVTDGFLVDVLQRGEIC